MAVVVVGGHTRNIGKTSVVAGLIAALRDMQWTAIKITQFGHGICSADGKPCDCETADHTIGISEEREANDTDSGRYVAAGAERSLWVRTQQGQLIDAIPRIKREMEQSQNTVIESNSILRFLRPDLYLSVLDPAVADFKDSARRYLDRADAILVPEGATLQGAIWKEVSQRLYRDAAVFRMGGTAYVAPDIVEFVRSRLAPSQAADIRAHLS